MPFQKGNQYGKLGKGRLSHGMSRSRLYRCWQDMKTRCNCETNPFYHRYGGRGITVCDDWQNFEPFMEWALSNGYNDNLTLDRIDNNGDYSPDNCKWSTQQEQSLNKTHLPSKTGYVGVRFRANRYQAEFTRDRKLYYVGRFMTAEEAAAAREEALRAWENGSY